MSQTLTSPTGRGVGVVGVGSSLGRYRLDRVLGQGGMGIVYAAHDPDLDRSVALKLLRGPAGEVSGARLLREARAMAKLAHPNVIAVFEVGSIEARDFIAMELVDGGSLDHWLSTPRTLERTLHVFEQSARGLAAAHAKGLIHRDFKPHNVLIGRDGRVVVTDFGLARALSHKRQSPPAADSTALANLALEATLPASNTTAPTLLAPGATAAAPDWSATLTETGALMGTPAYMAPEQWEATAIDPRTDQFAFCVALWEAIAGERPFTGTTFDELRAAIAAGPPETAPRIPSWLLPILRRGLRKRPEDRWRSMDELLAALERGRQRRRRRMIAVVASLALTAVAASAFALASGDRDRGTVRSDAAAARIERGLATVMALPAEPGNGGADYVDLIQHPVDLGIRWQDALNAESQPRLEQLSRDPGVLRRLEQMRAGSRKRTCHLLGSLIPWPREKNPLANPAPNVMSLLQHAAVARYLARELERHGDVAAAVEWLEVMVAIGWQLQQEPMLVVNLIGVMIAADVAEQLSDLWDRRGDNREHARRWRALAGLFRDRRYDASYRSFATPSEGGPLNQQTLPSLDRTGVERLAALADDPSQLPGVRSDAMLEVAIVHLVHKGSPEPSPRQRALLVRWMALDDPGLASFARYLAATLDLSPADRIAVGQEILEMIKTKH